MCDGIVVGCNRLGGSSSAAIHAAIADGDALTACVQKQQDLLGIEIVLVMEGVAAIFGNEERRPICGRVVKSNVDYAGIFGIEGDLAD